MPASRINVACFVAMIAAVANACEPGPTVAPASPAVRPDGPLVTVTFVDAVLAFSHDDGLAWDGRDVVPELARADLRVARSSPNAYARVLDVLAAHDAEAWGKPDPLGTVTLVASPSCRAQTQVLPLVRDTYRPAWTPGITFAHVPLRRDTRFRIVLEDDDAPRPADLVGSVDITIAALEDALANEGAVHRAPVGEQGQPIYFVGLRVTRE